MSVSLASVSWPVVPRDAEEFAMAMGVHPFLKAVMELTEQLFHSSTLSVSLGQDAEDERHRYIALDIDVAARTAEELLALQHQWTAGLARLCPPHAAVYFVLGWR
jgi:hypothetical protein